MFIICYSKNAFSKTKEGGREGRKDLQLLQGTCTEPLLPT